MKPSYRARGVAIRWWIRLLELSNRISSSTTLLIGCIDTVESVDCILYASGH